MRELVLARRYAKALLRLAIARDAVETVQAELDQLYQVLSATDSFEIMASPSVKPEAKLAAMAEVAKLVGLSDLAHDFLRRLIEAYRMDVFGDICDAYRAMSRERAGIIEARVTSAGPLSDAQRQKLQQGIEAKTGKKVLMEVDVDPALLAGAQI